MIVSVALLVMLFCAALIVAVAFRLTLTVAMLKLADAFPALTVTWAGTIARAGLLLDKLITNPPTGAGALSVTVPTATLPPTTVAGLTFTEVKLAAA